MPALKNSDNKRTEREHICNRLRVWIFFKVVKNHNFVTMSQLEDDKEVVALCRKSIKYRKALSGEKHEVSEYAMQYKEII